MTKEKGVSPGYYRHRSGTFYTVLMMAEDSANARERPDGTEPPVVIYVSHETGKVKTRPLEEFTELAVWPETEFTKKGERHPRFMRWPEPEHRK